MDKKGRTKVLSGHSGNASNEEEWKANREYKDSVFTMLFGTEEKCIELYNALSGSGCGPDTKATINTLSGVLSLGQMNDLSFVIGNRLVLIEHQLC